MRSETQKYKDDVNAPMLLALLEGRKPAEADSSVATPENLPSPQAGATASNSCFAQESQSWNRSPRQGVSAKGQYPPKSHCESIT